MKLLGIGSRIKHADFGLGVVTNVTSKHYWVTFIESGIETIDLDSDIEEARKKSGKSKKKEAIIPKKRKASGDDDDDDDSDDEDAKPKKKMKKKAPSASLSSKKTPKKKKDPNAPKKPQTAYFLFMNKNRAAYKEKYPEASFGELVSFPLVFFFDVVALLAKRIGHRPDTSLQHTRSYLPMK